MITSTSNAQVKEVCALQKSRKARRETGFFVAEGRRLLEEAPEELLERVYASESFLADAEKKERLPERLLQRTECVSDACFARMADTVGPQGILGVLRMPEAKPEELPDGPLLILENVQDPGNVGTLIRTAEAAGMGGILMNRLSADPFQPKTVRSAMGSLFRMRISVTDDLSGALRFLKSRGIRLYAAHLKGSVDYREPAYGPKTALLIGNEANGLSEEVTERADVRIRIPMRGEVESLNAAVSAAILMYESVRENGG